MARLTPYIYSEDAKAQAEFYVQSLGGEITEVRTYGEAGTKNEALKNKVMHLMLIAGGVTFFMADHAQEGIERGNGMDLNLSFRTEAEGQEAFDKLSAGGKVHMPLAKQFWGALFGRFADKYGVVWQISVDA